MVVYGFWDVIMCRVYCEKEVEVGMSMNNYGFIFYKIMFINYDVIFRFK